MATDMFCACVYQQGQAFESTVEELFALHHQDSLIL